MKSYDFIINGLKIEAEYDEEDVKNCFLPILFQMDDLRKKLDRRIVVYLSAPPGSGKSTFVCFLEYLAAENKIPLQSIGIDGFHYYQSYLDTHYLPDSNILLSTIKGDPYTFDVEKLRSFILALKEGNISWPLYSRTLHDPIEDQIYIDQQIILIEGNYLLYDLEPWSDMKDYCDYSLFISLNPDILENRLVKRKMMGGSTLEEAKYHYEHVDKVNVEKVLNHHYKPDIEICFDDSNKVCKIIK